MKVFISVLFNTKENTYHPMMYFEKPFPGDSSNLIRFKSHGHRSIGFKDREEALKTIQPEIKDRSEGYLFYEDLKNDIKWNGEGIPTDIKIFDKQTLKKFAL